ncbi:hypothetical protein PR202_ga10999 [Eleusine coracana subsp. coracana]|uniref:VWFA domain-containing protein n=1 Tax=Eleusine coracana subsp. coracana TaxID=191504 RepID=A0AAV5C8E8_ELECO|nr:hypothetical protein PR202_ga10999 [Eleusine coracana subsp. coracana]
MHAGAGRKQFRQQGERVRLVAYHNKEAPLEQHWQQVLLEVMDTSPSAAGRAGLDLVAVLDVSTSMKGENLKKLKTAMKFIISKLDPTDRLSIVSFSDEATVQCPLRCMTRASQEELKDMVENGLKAGGNTNIADGLKVLAHRRHVGGRVGSIVLMSDGEQNRGGKAEEVDIMDNVAVYTFGFGAGEFSKVLGTIASKSQGGTFYFVKDGESLSEHFSQILAGLTSVVVQDLKLTVWDQPRHSKIDKVEAGGYHDPHAPADDRDGSVTVSFGELFSGEERKVIVHLLLPAVDRDEYRATTVLFAQCCIQGKYMCSPRDEHLRCDMRRTRTAMSPDAVKPEVKAELVRCGHTERLREVSKLQEKDMDRAKGKLKETERDLLDAERSNNNHPTVKNLRTELTLLLSLTVWKEFISFVVASWTSHYRQRVASRGSVQAVPFFVTPRMPLYRKQAADFDKNPNMALPSMEEDLKQEEEAAARQRPVTPDYRPRKQRIRRRDDDDEGDYFSGERSSSRRSCSGWLWRLLILLCTVLAIAVIIAGVVVFVVFLLYKPKMPRLVVSDARIVQLQYDQAGTIVYVQAFVTILAENNNSKADASFNGVDLALGFHGADVAFLRAAPFAVPPESSLPLRYNVVAAGRPLDPDGMRAMDEALKNGVVPLDLFGKARTRWKVGVFVNLRFWTRLHCRLRFFFPGNGTVMDADRRKCHSRSP